MIEDAIVEVTRLDLHVRSYDWAFARDEAGRIDAHWALRRAAQPQLFDGRVLLMQDVAIADSCLRGMFFETGYRQFLSWKEFGCPGVPVANTFAMAALRASDGPFMLGAMSGTTSNGGRLYFPAGTPEPADVDAAGRVDFEANVLRELAEETGLGPQDLDREPGWIVVAALPFVACMKLFQARETAAALQARLARFNAAQVDPELAGFHPVSGPADYDAVRMPSFMIRFLDWAFAQAR